ncbi:hypothetical protein [Labilibaculum euxinus]
MIKTIYKILGLLMIVSISACSVKEQKVIVDIKSNPEIYNKITETISTCDLSRFSYNQNIGKEYFPKELNQAISETVLGDRVEYLTISKYSDCTDINFELISGKLHLRFEPCPRLDFPKPDSYEEEGLIERWGINNNWMIWKNNDFVY